MDRTTGFGPVDEGSIPSELVIEPWGSNSQFAFANLSFSPVFDLQKRIVRLPNACFSSEFNQNRDETRFR